MVLNSYAILIAFIAILRLFVGLLLIVLGVPAWRGFRPQFSRDNKITDRFCLLFMMAIVLLGLNLASWPLLYLLLRSYVSEFQGVMCIYGVTRIGEGTVGPARHLPGLLALLGITKPALVLFGGAWFVMYVLNRRCETSPLLRRLLIGLVPLGVLDVADSAAELAYIAIPKKEESPIGGCCTLDTSADRFQPSGITSDSNRKWVALALYSGSLGLIAALASAARRSGKGPPTALLSLLLIAAALLSSVGWVFLVDVASPILLALPHHHCPYDLVDRVPEAIFAVALFVTGGFLVSWALVARVFGSHLETDSQIGGFVSSLLKASSWCYLMALVMLSLELALA